MKAENISQKDRFPATTPLLVPVNQYFMKNALQLGNPLQ
jgi:hypothetical protein